MTNTPYNICTDVSAGQRVDINDEKKDKNNFTPC